MRFCVSVRWVTLWVCPPLCVCSIGNTVSASPSCLVCVLMKYEVMKYDVMKYGVIKYDVMKYEVMKYDGM